MVAAGDMQVGVPFAVVRPELISLDLPIKLEAAAMKSYPLGVSYGVPSLLPVIEEIERKREAADTETLRGGKNALARLWRANTPDRLLLVAFDGESRRDLWGVFWPGEAPGTVRFDNLSGTVLYVRFYPEGVDLEQWRQAMVALVERNYRNRVPLSFFACPECGVLFLPARRGQVYHERRCAATASQRERRERNRREKKNMGKSDTLPANSGL